MNGARINRRPVIILKISPGPALRLFNRRKVAAQLGIRWWLD
ncbi:hypothetical protein HMPREF0494_0206 [Limosilactobacillus antri DSM 16041]|uniref:Uncharacterized protein n=1 Tax=Limosilactobacillus antri DSM 16041 TaxID=525309 RepID=C8P4G2_9LACO|nr:hypothetical protein HMPREF0494_0206 [Limosilactobacillus antri DSM 16041]